jgi:hypothetical protein
LPYTTGTATTPEKRQALEKYARKQRQIVGIEEIQAANIIDFKRKVV